LLIARLARWHFAPTLQAANQLLAEGVAQQQVLITGNTVVDAIEMFKVKWKTKPYVGEAAQLFPKQELVLITTHRRENFGEGLRNICEAIRQLSQSYPELGFVFPVHLNPNVREVVLEELAGITNLQMTSPVDFEASLYLQSRACLIMTDSGGIQEESPSFGVPCVVMRQHTERTEGIIAGFAHLAGNDVTSIVRLARECLNANSGQFRQGRANPFGDGKSSRRILDQLMADTSPKIEA
jgi:UDP-N-acetylglucosamine 2-epimerase (non-hydrolysing)